MIRNRFVVGTMISGLSVLLHAGASFAADPPKVDLNRGIADAVGGAPSRGDFAFSLQAGWAFSAIRAQVGVTKRLAFIGEVESVLLLRNRPMMGVGMRWIDKPGFRLTGDALVGWLFQKSEETRRGPNAEFRVRLSIPLRRVVPYMVLGTRHAFLPDLTTIERASGTDSDWSVRHEWTPWATLGVGVALTRAWGLDLGLNYGWVGAPDSIALPGIHLGVHYGGHR